MSFFRPEISSVQCEMFCGTLKMPRGMPALPLGKHEMPSGTLSLPRRTPDMVHCTFDMPRGTLEISHVTLALPYGKRDMSRCKHQMPYVKHAIRLGRQHIPCRKLPALFLRKNTNNYRMFSEISRGNRAVFFFSGQQVTARFAFGP
jgi:hypothetical protein